MNRLFSDKELRLLIVPLIIEQILAITVGMADTMMISYAGAVSYTHLDVYKRQPYHLWGLCGYPVGKEDGHAARGTGYLASDYMGGRQTSGQSSALHQKHAGRFPQQSDGDNYIIFQQ